MSRDQTKVFSIRVSNDLAERIDQSAEHAGMTRTVYVLSWLPDVHERQDNGPTEQRINAPQQARR